jgi:hypothetical protein
MDFQESAEYFLSHREQDSTLSTGFWGSLLAAVDDASIFAPLGINSPFPKTAYYEVHVTTANNALQLHPSKNPPADSCQLIVRTSEQPLDSLKSYLMGELEVYESLTAQANDLLFPIGFGAFKSGCLTVFLANDLVTLESRLSELQKAPLTTRVSLAGTLVGMVCTAHDESGVSGFNIQPNTILIQAGSDDALALIGFVGGPELLKLHPQSTELKWNMEFAAPELKVGVKRVLTAPTASSDVHALACTLESILQPSPSSQGGDQMGVDVNSHLSGAKHRLPKNRISGEELHSRFMQAEKHLAEVDFAIVEKSTAPRECDGARPGGRPTSSPRASLDRSSSGFSQSEETETLQAKTGTESRRDAQALIQPRVPPSNSPPPPPEPTRPPLRERIRDMSRPLPSPGDGPHVFKVPQVLMAEDPQARIRAFSVGPRGDLPRTEVRILILGQTGSGKTTFLNGIVNWLYQVEWNDPFRFKVITEEDEGTAPGAMRNQAVSQTDHVTAYTFAYQSEFPIPNTVTIIDTPGFGDTRGIQRDQETVNQLDRLFRAQGRCGIDSIDGVAFVVQSALPRLDHAQRYIFDSVLKLFGKDIVDNLIIVATFADAGKPQVLQALKAGQIPDKHVCKFNNSALFAAITGEDGRFNQFFWDLGMENYRGFFGVLQQLQPRSLVLTKQVLDERKKLQATIDGLFMLVRKGVAKMNEIEQECHVIQQHQREIDANRNFTTQVKIQKSKKVDLRPGEYVTNCQPCNMTCHYPCYIPNNDGKHGCSAMRDGKCTVCPKKCPWDVHFNMSWRWELYEDVETRTLDALKAKYGDATAKKQTAEAMIARAEQEYIEMWKQTDEKLTHARGCVSLLQQIAARPTPLSDIDYIELQIEGEKQRAQLGWQDRVRFLEEVLARAKLMKTLVEGKESVLPQARLDTLSQSQDPFLKRFWGGIVAKLRRR